MARRVSMIQILTAELYGKSIKPVKAIILAVILGTNLVVNAFASEANMREKILALDDHSSLLGVGLNSFPGQNENLINEWVKANSPQRPFYVKIEYGTVVGTTKNGTPIKAASIYVVQPRKSSGYLWWKRVKLHVLKEPDWTLFKEETKPLSDSDSRALSSLLQ